MTRRPATNVPELVARLPLRRPSCVAACLLLAAALLLAGQAAAAPLWEPVGDVRLGLFATLAGDGVWAIDRLFPAEPCVPDERTLCLGDGGRFAARVLWQDPRFAAGPGRAVPRPPTTAAPSGSSAPTTSSSSSRRSTAARSTASAGSSTAP